MRNKAQFGGLQTIIIALVVIGIVLGIGFLLLEEFEDNINDYAGSVVNETISGLTRTGVYLAKNYTSIICLNSISIIRIQNASALNSNFIDPANYTYSTTTGLLQNSTIANYNSAILLNVTYTYKHGKGACEGIASTVTATKKIPTWLSIVVILLIVGIMLAIVFKVLPSAGGGGGGGFSFGRGSGGTVAEI